MKCLENLYVPVTTFLNFNVFATIGNVAANYVQWVCYFNVTSKNNTTINELVRLAQHEECYLARDTSFVVHSILPFL